MREFSNLANVILARTYARQKPNFRLETWSDVVERVIKGNVSNFNVSEQEINRLRYFMTERKAGPAGRGLWMSGSPTHAKIGGAGLVNCWAYTLDDWMNFVYAMDLLMLGGGVGFSVESRYVYKLPRVKKDVTITHKLSKDADWIVPDSREGWVETLRRVLESWFITGKSFTYSTICVRGPGEAISGFGGISSGPRPLIKAIEKICAVFCSRQGKQLHPIHAVDIAAAIGELVVSGNIRRSAIIFLGDAGDKEYLKAKRFDLGPVPTQRAMANFSVVADNAEDELGKLFWDTYRHGEPFGIVNRKNIRKYGRMGEEKEDTALIVNPCFPSWASVLTPIGIKTIGDVNIGDTIWSGSCWTKVINKESRGVKQVNGYVTSAGTFYGTENHKVLSHGQKIEAGQAKSIDTCVGPATNLKISQLDPQDIMNGLVFGDGFLHKATQKEMLIIGKNDGDYHNSEISNLIIANSSTTHWYVKTTYTPQERVWARNVPDGYYKGDFNQICGFLRGVYSANGSVVRNRITLKSTCLPAVGRIQSMLSALGISSYYTVNKKHNVKFDNGDYECKESYDLNIGTLEGRKIFAQAVGFIQKYKAEKLNKSILEQKRIKDGGKKTYEVKGILVLNQEEVFDITVEHESHALWNGNLHVGNCGEATLPSGSCCNLQNINLAAIDNIEEFKEAARLFHRYGKRVACEKYHIEYSNKIIHEENRVGTSITGCLQNPVLFNPNVLDTVYAEIQKENIKYSKELGIEPSIRTTTVNPGGTVSKLYDAVCEGIHPAYSRHIIQRVRIASNDPLIPKLRAAGHYMEPVERFDGTLDSDTYVVDFYVKAPDNAPCADEGFDTWKQLEALQVAQKHWADQSCSVTVYYNEEELGKVKEWVTDNLDSIKTISFLKHSGHKFKQAPKEPITKEQYEKLSSKIKPIETEDVGLGEVEGLGCEGGACPIR